MQNIGGKEMKAPDKIYVREYPVGLNQVWDEKPMVKTVAIAQHEYIRKDALMEWAKFVLKCQEEELAKYDGPSYMRASIMGRIDAYKVLIAKLNSL